MKARVYVETSVISYLTSRPSRDVVTAGHQQITRDWWQPQRETFDVVASQLVVQEASAGDPIAVQQRLEVLTAISNSHFDDIRANISHFRVIFMPLKQEFSHLGEILWVISWVTSHRPAKMRIAALRWNYLPSPKKP